MAQFFGLGVLPEEGGSSLVPAYIPGHSKDSNTGSVSNFENTDLAIACINRIRFYCVPSTAFLVRPFAELRILRI